MMKKLLFPLYLVMLITACKKQQYASIEVMAPDNIVGTWELRHVQNGMIPDVAYAPGNRHLLKLSLTDYRFYTNGQLEKSGSYVLVSDNSSVKGECFELAAGQSISRLIFDGDRNNSKIIQQPSANSLVMLSGCAALDSGSYTSYEKQ
jgi:hypothetical protein